MGITVRCNLMGSEYSAATYFQPAYRGWRTVFAWAAGYACLLPAMVVATPLLCCGQGSAVVQESGTESATPSRKNAAEQTPDNGSRRDNDPEAGAKRQDDGKQDVPVEKKSETVPAQSGTDDSVELPWKRKRENRIPRITLPDERELLSDLSEEDLLQVQDFLPLNQQSQRLFAQLLFRVPQFGLDNLDRLARKNESITEERLVTESGFHRFKVIRLEGIARHWEARKLVDEVGDLFDLSVYYKVKIRTANNHNVIVYCLSIPDAWKKASEISEEVSFQGIFVNLTLSREKESILNFIADRVSWAPRRKTDLVHRTGHALLGSAGFDLGLLDTLKHRNRKRLEAEDSEPFFQMLAAARTIADSRNRIDWENEVPRFDLIEVLKHPEKHHGELSLVEAEIRNITRITVEDPYVRDRLGIGEYFQLDGFVKFDASVTYQGSKDSPDGKSAKGAVFKKKYPVSLCSMRLPDGWKPGSGLQYRAVFPAFFFKVWAFPTGFQRQFSPEALQQSPLLVVLDPVELHLVSEPVNWTRIGLVLVLGAGIITIWTSYYISRVKREKNPIKFQLPSQIDAEGLGDQDDSQDDQPPSSGNELPVIRP